MRAQTEDSYAQTHARNNYRPGSPENPQKRRTNSVSWQEKATSVDNVDQPWWRRLGRWFADCWKGRNRPRNGRRGSKDRPRNGRRGSKERTPTGPGRDKAQRSFEKLDQDGDRRGHSRKAERRSRERRKRTRESAPRSKGRGSRDFTKSCCYLCAQNSMAIASASSRIPGIADTGVQAEIAKMANGYKMAETVEKSCGPSLRTTEVGTVCMRKRKKKSGLKIKRKSFWPFSRYVKCPGRGTVPCQTAKTERIERKSGSKRERCCGERNH